MNARIANIVFIGLLSGWVFSQSQSMSLEGIETLALDRYSVDGGKYKEIRAFIIVFHKDSVWLIEQSEELVMRFKIHNCFINKGNNVYLIENKDSLTPPTRMISETMVIKTMSNKVELYIWTGRVLRFNIKARKKW